MKILLKRLLRLKFAVQITNPKKVCNELEGPLFDMGLNVKII